MKPENENRGQTTVSEKTENRGQTTFSFAGSEQAVSAFSAPPFPPHGLFSPHY